MKDKNQDLVTDNNFTELLFYKTPNGKVKVEVFLRDETIWLTQARIGELFGVDRTAVTKHLSNIYLENELNKNRTCAKMAQVQNEGNRKEQIMKLTKIVILSLGMLCMNAYAAMNRDAPTNQAQPTTAVDKNMAEGEAFLAHNKKNKNVVTLQDGLQYKIIKQGAGPKPTDTDVVTVNYIGTLINGKEFDSSYKRNEPASFPVGGVIPGWTEALKLMPVGSTWMLYIPANLAYGEMGNPPSIQPNTTLIFKVELLGIKK